MAFFQCIVQVKYVGHFAVHCTGWPVCGGQWGVQECGSECEDRGEDPEISPVWRVSSEE